MIKTLLITLCVAISLQASELTEAEFAWDTLPAPGTGTPLAVTNGAIVNIAQYLAIDTLSPGLHRLFLRVRDEDSRWSSAESKLFYVFPLPGVDSLKIAQLELQVDDNTPHLYDVADQAITNLLAYLPAAELAQGPHQIKARSQDTEGTWSNRELSHVYVLKNLVPVQPSYIAGAELYINVDPGEGNGVALLPDDGAWDEAEEVATLKVPDIPGGFHKLGLRFMDNLGQWSNVVIDSFKVGPYLVISTSGSDVELRWTKPLDLEPEFQVYRAPSSAGTFSQITATMDTTYTDPGILTSDTTQYYQITFSTSAPSPFRLPAAAASRE